MRKQNTQEMFYIVVEKDSIRELQQEVTRLITQHEGTPHRAKWVCQGGVTKSCTAWKITYLQALIKV